MRICGIIAEYNPFHNGHEKHIQLTRKRTGADLIVCVMSGNFVQRGEPAVFDKWLRTACALAGGADAVIELPLLYATQSAEGFAAGGVKILDALGAHAISFGAETDDARLLTNVAKTLSTESSEFRQSLKNHLDSGLSFPKARMKAAFPDAPDEINMPNAILGIEYVKAIFSTQSKLTPYVIKRVGEDYHSDQIHSFFSSATAIRKALAEQNFEQAYNAMPRACVPPIRQAINNGLSPVFPDAYDRELLYILRQRGPKYIKTLHDVTEGLENRIYEASKTCGTRIQLIEKIKTKRYTYTRISRILLYALLGITKDIIAGANGAPIDHVRVLGVREPGVLSTLSKTCTVPIISGSAAASPYPGIDAAASDVYALTQKTLPYFAAARDYTEKLILL